MHGLYLSRYLKDMIMELFFNQDNFWSTFYQAIKDDLREEINWIKSTILFKLLLQILIFIKNVCIIIFDFIFRRK